MLKSEFTDSLSPSIPIVHRSEKVFWSESSVLASRPALTGPCVGVYKITSLTSPSLLPQQFPACLVRLICIICEMRGGGRSRRTAAVLRGAASRIW